MKTGAVHHRKMKKLARLLKVPGYSAVGIMEMLWIWTGDNAIAGNIGTAEDFEIEDAVGWPSTSEIQLIPALIEAGWVDPCPEHRLIIHDWPEHCPDFIHTRLFRAGKCFANGAAPKVKMSSVSSAHRGDLKSEPKKTVANSHPPHDEDTSATGKLTSASGTNPNQSQPIPTQPSGAQDLPTPDTDPPPPPKPTPPPPRGIKPETKPGLHRVRLEDFPVIPGSPGPKTDDPQSSAVAKILADWRELRPRLGPVDPELVRMITGEMSRAGMDPPALIQVLRDKRESIRKAESWGLVVRVVEAACRSRPLKHDLSLEKVLGV